ncbi:MAG: universal stress protein [Acidimicrobiales bacterium]
MDVPQRILVPVDLSDRSALAVGYAGMLATRFGAELILSTNINLPERAILEDLGAADGLSVTEAGEIELGRIANEHASGTTVRTEFTFADFPAEGILRAANTHDVDMIVIASHGHSGMTRWLLGSIAEKIARSATVPVVIVPARDKG